MGCGTFRSLLSSRISSEPWMSCRIKISLYSPNPSVSSQAATSSAPHLSARRERKPRSEAGHRHASVADAAPCSLHLFMGLFHFSMERPTISLCPVSLPWG